jgi:ABC-type proline/glycine betaine transport system substrate-binding protein
VEKANLKKGADLVTESQNITLQYTRCKGLKKSMTSNVTPYTQNTIEQQYRERFERDGSQSYTGAPIFR